MSKRIESGNSINPDDEGNFSAEKKPDKKRLPDQKKTKQKNGDIPIERSKEEIEEIERLRSSLGLPELPIESQQEKNREEEPDYGDEREIILDKKRVKIRERVYKQEDILKDITARIEEIRASWLGRFGLRGWSLAGLEAEKSDALLELNDLQDQSRNLREQIKAIQTEADVEDESTKWEFSTLCEKVKGGIEEGRILYSMMTKPPFGKKFMGENWPPMPKSVAEHIYPSSIKDPREIGYDYLFDKEDKTDLMDLRRIRNFVYLRPARKGKFTEHEDSAVGKKIKNGDLITIQDVTGTNEKNERNKKMVSLTIMYTNYSKGYIDNRIIRSSFNLLLESRLANKILKGIKEDRDKFWELIKTVFPDLFEAWPPGLKDELSDESPIYVYKSEEAVEIEDIKNPEII